MDWCPLEFELPESIGASADAGAFEPASAAALERARAAAALAVERGAGTPVVSGFLGVRGAPGRRSRDRAGPGSKGGLGAAAELWPSTAGVAALSCPLPPCERRVHATINASTTANAAAPSTQLMGTEARTGAATRSVVGGAVSRKVSNAPGPRW